MDSPVCAAYPFAASYGTSKDESTLRGGMVLSNESKRLVQGDHILRTIGKKKRKKKDETICVNNSRLDHLLA